MTVIPLSPYELINLILTVILIYVTWRSYKDSKNSGNTKK